MCHGTVFGSSKLFLIYNAKPNNAIAFRKLNFTSVKYCYNLILKPSLDDFRYYFVRNSRIRYYMYSIILKT